MTISEITCGLWGFTAGELFANFVWQRTVNKFIK
jgi:hypothetical protein